MPRGSLWRWRRWIVAFGVLIGIRAALPEIVRRVMISQVSQALGAHVAIGDVDLALYRLGIALKDVTIRPAAPALDDGSETPLIAWRRVGLEVRWLPLLRKTVRLRQVVLESPRVAFDRLADGRLNVLALLPPRTENQPAAEPPPAAIQRSWGFGLDRVILRDGGLRFRDLTIKDSEPVEINLEHVEVTDIALEPGLYGEPSNLHLAIAFDQGSLDLQARVALRADGMSVESNLNAWGLPLRQARLYIPKVGWSALDGTLDAAVAYRSAAGRQNEISGTVALRDVSVRVPALDEPALAWRSLTVRIDPLDLIAHRAAISEIDLDGATVLVRPQGGDLLPMLASSTGGHAEEAPPASPAEDAPVDAATPWTWSVASIHVGDSRVRLLGRQVPLDVGVGLNARDLTGDSDQPTHVEVALKAGDGSVNVDGHLRLRSPGFAGTVHIADLSLPELIAAASPLPSDLVQAAHLMSDLTIEAGLAVPDGGAVAAGDVRVHGRLSLADPQIHAPGAQPLSLSAQSIDLDLKELQIAGVLAGAPTDAAGSGDVRLAGKLALVEPAIATADQSGVTGGARSIELTLDDLLAAGVVPGARAGGAPPRGDLQARARLALADLHAAIAGPQGVSIDAGSIELGIGQLSAQGLLPAATGTALSAPELRVRNSRLSLAQFKLAGADSKAFLIGTRTFELPIKELSVSGDSGTVARPARVAIGAMCLAGAVVQVTRTTDGLLLPQLAAASAPTPAAPSQAAAGAVQSRPIEVTLESLRLTDAKVSALDRTVKPFFSGGLSPLDIEVRDLRWPAMGAGKIHIAATGPEQGKIDVVGMLKPDEGWFEVRGDELALPPLNPYATAFSSYSIGSGTLSLVTKGSFKSGRYNADTSVTLHDFNLQSGGGDALFQQQFGIPVELALALMRDVHGNIGLGIPIEADAQGTKVDVLAVIGGALRRAIVNALASPLKLVGAVFGGDHAQIAAPAPIAFRPGRAELDPSGSQQADQLADFLASRPGIGVTLEPSVTNSDVRWLREQALRQEWEGEGVVGALRNLTQRSQRERVRRALEARAKDQPADLSAEDATALDGWLAAQPPIPPERLRALTEERLTRTEAVLREGHGIDAARLARRAPTADLADGAPAVRVALGAVAR